MRKFYVGLDVHSKDTVFAIQTEDGSLVARGSVPTSAAGLEALRERHQLPPGTAVGLETGTVSFYVARQLHRLGLQPIVVDAMLRSGAFKPRSSLVWMREMRKASQVCPSEKG